MKILLMHNTLPEYRIKWFNALEKRAEVQFVFTNERVNYQKYKTSIQKDSVSNSVYLSPGMKGFNELRALLDSNESCDAIELPPVDTLREYLLCKLTVRKAKRKGIAVAFFWEKWEAPISKQPLKRKIKNLILGTAAWDVYRSADIIFAGSTSCKAYFLRHGIRDSQIIVLPEASEVPECPYENIREKYNIPPERILLLYFGRLMPEKGAGYLLEAFSQLNESEYHLLIAGDGSFRAICEKNTQDLQLKNVTFAGAVDPSKRKNYFEQCDIFVFPGTYYQGRVDVWGLTNNEAMQFGKPVVSTWAVGSAKDLIKDGINGYLVEPENSMALKIAIEKSGALKNPAVEYDKKLMKTYSSENMANVFLESIEKYMNRE